VKKVKVEGRNSVYELLKTDKEIDKILVRNDLKDEASKRLINVIKSKRIKIQLVDKFVIDKESEGKRSQGFIAFVSDYKYFDIDDIISDCKDKDGFIVFFRDLHDRIDHRRIGRESVEKRLHLDSCELFVAQIVLQHVVSILTEICVYPAERDYFVGHLFESVVELFIQRARRRAEDRFFDVIIRHLLFQHLSIEIDIERASEKADVRVCVDFFESCETVHFDLLNFYTTLS